MEFYLVLAFLSVVWGFLKGLKLSIDSWNPGLEM